MADVTCVMSRFQKFSLLKKDLIKECNTYLSFLNMFAKIFSRHFQQTSTDSNDILMNIHANLEGFRTNPLNLLEYLNKNLSERSLVFDLLSLDKVSMAKGSDFTVKSFKKSKMCTREGQRVLETMAGAGGTKREHVFQPDPIHAGTHLFAQDQSGLAQFHAL